jgi:hypothetical protein
MTNRREFLLGTAALAGAAGLGARAESKKTVPEGPVRLKFAAFSDIHVTGRDSTQANWEKGLRKADDWGADAVLVCGDLADYGLDVQMEAVAETWFKVFPDGKRSDGQPVANLLHYGDHDTSGYTYRGCPPCKAAWPDEDEMKKHILRYIDRKAVWERCFKDTWAPIVKKTVKGYDFIISHFTKGEKGNEEGNNVPGLEEFMTQADLESKRPFFYSQHRIPRNTAAGPYAWGQEDGKTTKLFSEKYPNCFAFCGHHHLTVSEEQAIWQGGFTCVAVPSLLYNCTLAGRENSTHCEWDSYFTEPALTMTSQAGWNPTQAGLLVTVYDNAIALRRCNFRDDVQVGPDWIVSLPILEEKPNAHAFRAANDPAPEFAPGAEVTCAKTRGKDMQGVEQDFYCIEFPMAFETAATPRANDYEVAVELLRCDVTLTVASYRVFSPLYGRASSVDKENVKCLVPCAKVPNPGFQKVRFAVRPVNSFGTKGNPLYLYRK